jgi:predicted transposase/invertase (TIGR01784 family)
MKAAVSRLVHLSEDERARMLYEARELAMMDEMARIEGAKKEGIAKGEKQGLKRGERTKALDMARKMLKKGIDVYEVAEISGLSLDEVESLRE